MVHKNEANKTKAKTRENIELEQSTSSHPYTKLTPITPATTTIAPTATPNLPPNPTTLRFPPEEELDDAMEEVPVDWTAKEEVELEETTLEGGVRERGMEGRAVRVKDWQDCSISATGKEKKDKSQFRTRRTRWERNEHELEHRVWYERGRVRVFGSRERG